RRGADGEPLPRRRLDDLRRGDPALRRCGRAAGSPAHGHRDEPAAPHPAAGDPRRRPAGGPVPQTSGFDHLVLPSAGNWGDPGNLWTHDDDVAERISPDVRRRPEYDEAIALAATLEAWGERLATASPVPLSAVPVDGIAVGGALALEGGGHVVGPAETDGLA